MPKQHGIEAHTIGRQINAESVRLDNLNTLATVQDTLNTRYARQTLPTLAEDAKRDYTANTYPWQSLTDSHKEDGKKLSAFVLTALAVKTVNRAKDKGYILAESFMDLAERELTLTQSPASYAVCLTDPWEHDPEADRTDLPRELTHALVARMAYAFHGLTQRQGICLSFRLTRQGWQVRAVLQVRDAGTAEGVVRALSAFGVDRYLTPNGTPVIVQRQTGSDPEDSED